MSSASLLKSLPQAMSGGRSGLTASSYCACSFPKASFMESGVEALKQVKIEGDFELTAGQYSFCSGSVAISGCCVPTCSVCEASLSLQNILVT